MTSGKIGVKSQYILHDGVFVENVPRAAACCERARDEGECRGDPPRRRGDRVGACPRHNGTACPRHNGTACPRHDGTACPRHR